MTIAATTPGDRGSGGGTAALDVVRVTGAGADSALDVTMGSSHSSTEVVLSISSSLSTSFSIARLYGPP